MTKDKHPELFDIGESWEEAWRGMPEFVQKDLEPWKTIYVHFENREAMEAFAELVDQTINLTTASIWYPEAEIGRFADRRYIDAAAKAKPRDPEAKNKFVEEAESGTITSKEWSHLLNCGLNLGSLKLDEIDALIIEKFKVKTRNLKSKDYEEALAVVSEKKK